MAFGENTMRLKFKLYWVVLHICCNVLLLHSLGEPKNDVLEQLNLGIEAHLNEALESLTTIYGGKDFSFFPGPEQLLSFTKNSTLNDEEKRKFKDLYENAMQQFDLEGYKFLMDAVLSENSTVRFAQSLNKMGYSQPHCDQGRKGTPGEEITQPTKFPGGPIVNPFGFDITKWMMSMLTQVETSASSAAPGMAGMVVQAFMMIKGFIQAAAATVMDVVPPMIPPPAWINRPLPCLPMLTGMNCLGSILYPISLPEFITADVADASVEGVISSFPAKYAAKVGRTSEAAYKLCAMAYLGLHCASSFPICILPMGIEAARTYPTCFPQCIAALLACPGFWIDDIIGPCSDVSIPPFCSFSLYINQRMIPPQLISYEESHPFPKSCPKMDPKYDTPDDLYEPRKPLPSPIAIAAKEEPPLIPAVPPLGKSMEDYLNVQPPIHKEPTPCDCHSLGARCKATHGIPVVVQKYGEKAYMHHETPAALTVHEKICCNECRKKSHKRNIQKKKNSTKKNMIKKIDALVQEQLKLPLTNGPKIGHILPP